MSKPPPASVAVVARVPDGVWTMLTEALASGLPFAVTAPWIAEEVSWAWAAVVMAHTSALRAAPWASLLKDIIGSPP